ncbi:hypothetical protein J3R82DRAFT_1875 [Butyriboletus roseoflavus]|nr:hypothetical protein J3R82DRAFT_1875 [Butyriboletus roseoflavus]
MSTLVVSVTSDDLNPALLPCLFWATASYLMTVVELEFTTVVNLLTMLLGRLDLGNAEFIKSLLAQCPESWNGMYSLQTYLLSVSLRSATAMADTFVTLQSEVLTRVSGSWLIEPSKHHICDLFALSRLPQYLYSMSGDNLSGQILAIHLQEQHGGSCANMHQCSPSTIYPSRDLDELSEFFQNTKLQHHVLVPS